MALSAPKGCFHPPNLCPATPFRDLLTPAISVSLDRPLGAGIDLPRPGQAMGQPPDLALPGKTDWSGRAKDVGMPNLELPVQTIPRPNDPPETPPTSPPEGAGVAYFGCGALAPHKAELTREKDAGTLASH